MEDKNVTNQNQNNTPAPVSDADTDPAAVSAAQNLLTNTNASTNSPDESPSLFRKDTQDPAAVSGATAHSSLPSTALNMDDIFPQFAEKIIKEQEGIIGPIAYEQAAKVSGLTIDPATHVVKMTGDKKQILENLVKQYELLFGRVSIEICKEAVRGVISSAPADQVPQILL
jgi:hypothetical protein